MSARRIAPRTLLAIDPGPTQSAYVYLRGMTPVVFGKAPNAEVLADIAGTHADQLAIEMIASYGRPVGVEVFETCVWIGRFEQAWLNSRGTQPRRVFRLDVKKHITHGGNANDAVIRQALIDRYGPGKDRAVGRKAAPGPLYGVSGDVWAALGVGLTALETPESLKAAS